MATRSDAWAEAHRLVVHEGYSYTEAAEATGIPLSTLQKRAASEEWRQKRDVQMSYAAQVRTLKAGLLAQALKLMSPGADGEKPPDPAAAAQLVYAWKQAESTYPEHRYGGQKDDPKVRLAVALEVLDALVAYLGRSDRAALTKLEPHLAPFARELEARVAS